MRSEDEIPYEERYCAFLDILGFREIIRDLDGGKFGHRRVMHLLGYVHKPTQINSLPTEASDFKAQSISDAVCLSAKANAPGLYHIFSAVESIASALLFEGHFLRGAIVKGKLFHADSMVFGPALITAYELESTVVRYPRVMITSPVASDIHGFQASLPQYGRVLQEYTLQSDDGPRFLHILKGMITDLGVRLGVNSNLDIAEDANIAFLADMRDKIQKAFLEATDNPRHFEKVQWFAKYWNDHMPDANGLRKIQGPGVLPPTAVWG